MASAKYQIISLIGTDIVHHYLGTDKNTSWARKHFILWCEGSYDNGMEWEATRLFLEDNLNDQRQLRRFVIRQFTEFVAYEFGVGYSHAQKCIVEGAQGEDELEKYTRILIDDLIDHFVDDNDRIGTLGIHIK